MLILSASYDKIWTEKKTEGENRIKNIKKEILKIKMNDNNYACLVLFSLHMLDYPYLYSYRKIRNIR